MRLRIPGASFPIGLLLLAAVSRLLPHPPNVAPIAAIALLGGSALPFPWSFAIPLTAMALSDVFLGFDNLPITAAVYGSFALTVLLGRWVGRRQNPWRVLGGALAASTLFYLVTNAAVWWFSGLYPRSLDGLILSYLFAIPFFRHTLLGDLAYTTTLFFSFQYFPALAGFLRGIALRKNLRGQPAVVRDFSAL